MRKNFAIALVIGLVFSAAATAAIPLTGAAGDDIPTLVYTPADGSLSFNHPTDENGANAVTTLEIVWTGEGDFFTGPRPESFAGLFDVWTGGKAFRLDPAGYTSMGPWGVASNISADAFGSGITVDGSFAGGGALTVDALVIAIPEPSSLTLIGIASLGLLRLRRRK